MLRRILFIGGACLGVALMVSPAFGRNPAAKAGKYQATLVQGVQACTVTNTTAPGVLNTAACDPVVPSDSVCVFGPKGKGSVAAKAKTDVAVQAKLGGLEASCDGETICAVAGVRTTVDSCASSGSCSTITQPDLPLGIACATVAKGKWKFKGTISQTLAGALTNGNRTEITIGEVGLVRAGGGVAFRAGVRVD